MRNKCNLTACTLKEKCQRFHPQGENTPILPFLVSLETPEGPFNGCEDYWPVGTGVEFFLNDKKTKTPVE